LKRKVFEKHDPHAVKHAKNRDYLVQSVKEEFHNRTGKKVPIDLSLDSGPIVTHETSLHLPASPGAETERSRRFDAE